MVHSRPTVVLTRSSDDNAPLSKALQAHGVEVVEVPTACLRDVPPEPPAAVVRDWLASARAVAFTSRHGVLAGVRALGPQALGRAGLVRAAVGEATAEALAGQGLAVEVLADGTGAQLAEALAAQLAPGDTVVAVQGRHARPELAEGLRSRGLLVQVAVVYANAEPDPPPATQAAAARTADLVYLAAPSAADRLLAWLPDLRDRRFAAIGPTTAAELRARHGIEPVAIAPRPDLATVLDTLLAALNVR